MTADAQSTPLESLSNQILTVGHAAELVNSLLRRTSTSLTELGISTSKAKVDLGRLLAAQWTTLMVETQLLLDSREQEQNAPYFMIRDDLPQQRDGQWLGIPCTCGHQSAQHRFTLGANGAPCTHCGCQGYEMLYY